MAAECYTTKGLPARSPDPVSVEGGERKKHAESRKHATRTPEVLRLQASEHLARVAVEPQGDEAPRAAAARGGRGVEAGQIDARYQTTTPAVKNKRASACNEVYRCGCGYVRQSF